MLLLLVAAPAHAVWIGVDSDLLSQDPVRAVRHQVTDTVLSLVYDTLLAAGEGREYAPGLAVSIEALTPRIWELRLPAADMARVRTDDVLHALATALQWDSSGRSSLPMRERLAAVESVTRAGTDALWIHLREPWPALPTALTAEFIPVAGLSPGSGPYSIARWERGNRVVLSAREPWQSPAEVGFEVIPSSLARLGALRSGRIDVMHGVPLEQMGAAAAVPGVDLYARTGTRAFFLEMNTTRPPFDDVRVRRAFNLALNVPQALCRVRQGVGLVAASLVPATSFGHHGGLEPFRQDVDAARRLLSEAGYPNGFDFEFDYLPHREDLARVYRDMLARIGVNVHLRKWRNWTELRAELTHGERMAWTSEWDNSSGDPGSVLWAKVATGGTANYGGYSNATVDALLRRADSAHSPAERLALYRQVQQLLYDDAAFVFEYVEQEIVAVRENVAEELMRLGPWRQLLILERQADC